MESKYRNGLIEIDLHALLVSVSPETKRELIESLACDDEIIKHVADQIITRWTENCCSGGSLCVASETPYRGLDWAWREVAKRSGEVAKREIERLEDALKHKEKLYSELLNENAALRRGESVY